MRLFLLSNKLLIIIKTVVKTFIRYKIYTNTQLGTLKFRRILNGLVDFSYSLITFIDPLGKFSLLPEKQNVF